MDNKNNDLGLIGGMVNSPAFLPSEQIGKCASFRDAVRLGWANRRSKGMTKSTLAELCGLYAPHVTDYLNAMDKDSHGRTRRSLPAEKIAAFECAVGNRAATQFLVRQVELNLMEEWQAQMGKKAA